MWEHELQMDMKSTLECHKPQEFRVHTYNWHEFNKLQQADLEIFSRTTNNCTANHNKNKDEQTKPRSETNTEACCVQFMMWYDTNRRTVGSWHGATLFNLCISMLLAAVHWTIEGHRLQRLYCTTADVQWLVALNWICYIHYKYLSDPPNRTKKIKKISQPIPKCSVCVLVIQNLHQYQIYKQQYFSQTARRCSWSVGSLKTPQWLLDQTMTLSLLLPPWRNGSNHSLGLFLLRSIRPSSLSWGFSHLQSVHRTSLHLNNSQLQSLLNNAACDGFHCS